MLAGIQGQKSISGRIWESILDLTTTCTCVLRPPLINPVVSCTNFSLNNWKLHLNNWKFFLGDVTQFPAGDTSRSLSLESTLQELNLHDCRVEPSCLGWQVAQTFKENPLLPGVILCQGKSLLGMVSRRRFFELMSRPYGLELFSRRPIKSLHRSSYLEPLVLNSTTPIITATRQSLQRPVELLYEPLVVDVEPGVYHLLDVHHLLMAQSYIHELATQLVTQLYGHLETTNQQLQQLASCDGLTGVANRRRFDEYLQLCCQQLQGTSFSLSLILCDVDFFKAYNDRYGHLAGDDCLRQVASAIGQSVKRSEDLVARYGGEEFAIILPHTSLNGAIHVAQRVRSAVEGLQLPHAASPLGSDHPAPKWVTVSVGVASLSLNSPFNPVHLIELADQKLYQAKQNQRNCVVW